MDRDNVRDILPLSPMQEGLLYHAADDPSAGLYHVQLLYDIAGTFDPLLFADACDAVATRHDALRAVFVHETNERPLQVILRARPPLVTYDHGLDVETWRRADREQPFDLAGGPLIRFRLLEREPGQWTVMLSYHHIVMDGWSNAIVIDELLSIYNDHRIGRMSRLEPAPPLKHYAEWLRALEPRRAVLWWRDALRGWNGFAPFAGWYRPTGERSIRTITRTLPQETTRPLGALAAAHSITLAALVETVWGVVTARDGDAVFGAVVSGRPAEVPGCARMVGLFVNSVPRRVRFSADEELLAIGERIHHEAQESLPHHHASLAAVQSAVGEPLLFDHLLALQTYPTGRGMLAGGLEVTAVESFEASSYDLVVKVAPAAPFRIEIDYNAAAFDAAVVEAIADRFAEALSMLARRPDVRASELPRLDDLRRATGVATPASASELRALHDPAAARVLAIWSEILGTDDLTLDDNFFDIGGHSLKAMQLVSKLRRAFDVQLTVREIFAHPTAGALAALMRKKTRVAGETIAPAPPQEHYPLSHAQQRVWLVERLSGPSATYNIPLTVVCGPDVDLARLEASVRGLVDRHEVLRTTFLDVDGEPRQVVRDCSELRIATIDLRATPDADAASKALTAEEIARPFDLTKELPVRATFVLLPNDQTLLIVNIHHIAADGWSLRLLAGELDALYAGEALPPPPLQYKDYAVWDESRDRAEDERWWLERLRGRVELVRLPHDAATGHEHRFAGGAVTATLTPAVTAALRALAASRQTTLANVGLAVFFAFLHHLTGQRSLSVAVSIANRALHPELERVAGFFVNALVIRVDVDPSDHFADLLGRVVDESLAAFEHQSYPFDLLVEKLRPARVGEEQPLFNVNYVFQSFHDLRLRAPGARSPLAEMREIEPVATTAKFDLTLFACEVGGALQLSFEYSRRLFTEESARRYMRMFVRFLDTVVAPEEVAS
jgi:non-ribosomal peptide synthetase component F